MAKQLSDGINVIALDVSLGRIQEITEDIAEQTPGSYGIVLDKTGQVIAHSDVSELGKNYLEETGTLGAELASVLYAGNSRHFELSFDGQKYVAFVESIEGDWQVISLINTNLFYRPLRIILLLVALFTLMEAVVFVAVIYTEAG